LAGGPFEQLGIDWMVGLGWGYVGLSVLEVLAGILLWKRRRGGASLSVGLILPALVFWVGFALPFPPLVAAIRRLWLLWAGRRAFDSSERPVGWAVLPAVLPNGNAQDNTEQHEPAQESPLTWTEEHQTAPDGQRCS